MAEIRNNFWRYVVGILTGMASLLIIIHLYPTVSNAVNNTSDSNIDSIQRKITTKKDSSQLLVNIINLRTEIGVESEKVNSLNSRFNDFYIFTGIIITLLLAVNVSVYIRTDNEVAKHMKKNYEAYKDEIAAHVQDAKKLLGEMQTQATVASAIMNNFQGLQSISPDKPN